METDSTISSQVPNQSTYPRDNKRDLSPYQMEQIFYRVKNRRTHQFAGHADIKRFHLIESDFKSPKEAKLKIYAINTVGVTSPLKTKMKTPNNNSVADN